MPWREKSGGRAQIVGGRSSNFSWCGVLDIVSILCESCPSRYNGGMRFDGLPGYELVAQGLEDLASGRETVASLLLCVGAPRLRALGLTVPMVEGPEHRLYARLSEEFGDGAHARYNALIRRLVSFERAAECAD